MRNTHDTWEHQGRQAVLTAVRKEPAAAHRIVYRVAGGLTLEQAHQQLAMLAEDGLVRCETTADGPVWKATRPDSQKEARWPKQQ